MVRIRYRVPGAPSITSPSLPVRQSSAFRQPVASLVLGIVVFVLALVSRAQGLEQYVTVDEDLTLGRTGAFSESLERGRWQRTYQIGHPEVTVMWIGTLALQPAWAREYAGTVIYDGQVARTREVTEQPRFMEALGRARLGMALANSLVIAIATLLLWRVAGPAAAAIGGAMLSFEPFLVAHGQLLRSDGLLAELMLVAVLAGAAYWLRGAGRWALILASLATGLALLTKTPAVLVLPILGGMALLSPRRLSIVPWAIGVVLTYVILWPAMWVIPMETLERVLDYTVSKGGAPMDAGSFLLGEASADPGPTFYLAALGLRLSPAILAGLLALVFWRGGGARPIVLALLAACIVTGAAMAVAPKKADRYMLPIIPALVVLAGFGVTESVRRWGARGTAAAIVAVAVVQLGGLLLVRPYPLAYYNPLLGGASAASNILLVGWGEGLDQVAAALNARPGAETHTAAVFYPDTLEAQYLGRAVPLESYDIADYAVRYIASEQRHLTPGPLDESLKLQEPLFSVTLNGAQYAQVYELPDPEFERGIALESILLRDPVVERGRPVGLWLRWRTGSELTGGWRPFITLIREGGDQVAEIHGSLYPGLLAPGEIVEERIRFNAPDRLGRYAIAVSVRAEPDGTPLNVIRRPAGTEPAPTQLLLRSLSIRVQ